MSTLLRSMSVQDLLTLEAPSLILSFIIAELFYKFHSFTLETGAFLVTWFVLGWLTRQIVQLVRGRRGPEHVSGRPS